MPGLPSSQAPARAKEQTYRIIIFDDMNVVRYEMRFDSTSNPRSWDDTMSTNEENESSL
jgi:hypothetical protein